MRLKSGIVGLPNVGKSTLFNALVENSNAQAANFPFCTIEPNVGIAVVPDARLNVLSDLNESAKVVPTSLEFVDIAGLVAGASKGEGLGNQFLANIRECDAIVHVVRCFDDENIIHVSGSVDPLRDIEVINLELALADMGQIERRLARTKSRVKAADAGNDPHEAPALKKIAEALDDGRPARAVPLSEEERAAVGPLGLLTMKPVIYAANVADADLAEGNEWVETVRGYAKKNNSAVVVVSAQVESELVALDAGDRVDFLESLGVTEDQSGLRALVRASYKLLGLRTYFTSGPTETRAWTIPEGFRAPQAAGVIHTDFERFVFHFRFCIGWLDSLTNFLHVSVCATMQRIHSRGDDRVRRAVCRREREGGEGEGAHAVGRERLRRCGGRRDVVPIQRVMIVNRLPRVQNYAAFAIPSSSKNASSRPDISCVCVSRTTSETKTWILPSAHCLTPSSFKNASVSDRSSSTTSGSSAISCSRVKLPVSTPIPFAPFLRAAAMSATASPT